MTGLVLVSHSAELARAALGLTTGLIPGLDVRVELAAGLPDGGLGTDATEVAAAIERATTSARSVSAAARRSRSISSAADFFICSISRFVFTTLSSRSSAA